MLARQFYNGEVDVGGSSLNKHKTLNKISFIISARISKWVAVSELKDEISLKTENIGVAQRCKRYDLRNT